MTVRQLTIEDRMQAEATWREIFEDSMEFTGYYFQLRFHPEHSFGAFDGDRLIAMTLGRPTMIRVNGRNLAALLLAGVSTRPEYRGNGLMHRLVSLQIAHAKDKGFSCCFLHPVSESLYTSLGFVNGTEALIIRSDSARRHPPFDLRECVPDPDLLFVYHSMTDTHDGMELRDEREMKTVFSDYATEECKIIAAYEKSKPIGYICYSPNGTVFELFALCASVYEALIDEAAKDAGKELKAVVPADCGVSGDRVCNMQYVVFNDAFRLPLSNGFCVLGY